MSQESDQQILSVLKEIRDGQREIVTHLESQRALATEQLRKSQERVEESVGLQKEALRRQQSIMRMVVPSILVCIAAIAYLIIRYL
ncbi:MAG TPA: hypothetical protein PKL53_04650 [Methylotenera sp.]|nr:hypothetical protein [Methylotenera sp.]HPV45658.1 hypothetical protein [Methylotenera sp.]